MDVDDCVFDAPRPCIPEMLWWEPVKSMQEGGTPRQDDAGNTSTMPDTKAGKRRTINRYARVGQLVE
jgi:hypothetical protein